MIVDGLDLLLLDVDGTIAERHSSQLNPNAREFFKLLAGGAAGRRTQQIPAVGLVTNQGGVGLRMWMEESLFGDPDQYPTLDVVRTRLAALVAQIPVETKLYVSYAYQTQRTKEWAPVPYQFAGMPEWSRSWRKPQPGMILAAMKAARVTDPEKVLLVGDQETDEDAAIAAGIRFVYARTFWERVPAFLGISG